LRKVNKVVPAERGSETSLVNQSDII